MNKKQRPSISSYAYLINSLLTAKIDHNGTITEDDIKEAVTVTVKTYDILIDALGDDEEESVTTPVDWFEDYPWNGTPQRYTDLMKWLTSQGVTSKRRQSDILHECIKNGFIMYDERSKKYAHTQP